MKEGGEEGVYFFTLDKTWFFHNHDRHFNLISKKQAGFIPVVCMQCSMEKCFRIKQFFILEFFSPQYIVEL